MFRWLERLSRHTINYTRRPLECPLLADFVAEVGDDENKHGGKSSRKTRNERQGHHRDRAPDGRQNASDVRLLNWGEGHFARSGARSPKCRLAAARPVGA